MNFIRIFISILFVMILLPLFLLIGIVIIFSDGRPVIFRQKRIGLKNKIFYIFKFRTMKNNIGDIPTHLLDDKLSKYIKFGQAMRRFSLDELPQLFNIIKGDMLFIGPRPALFNQKDLIKYRTTVGIHNLKPGITGWAQVNGRDELSIKEKVALDKYYLINQSIFLDIKILFLTLFNVSQAKNVTA